MPLALTTTSLKSRSAPPGRLMPKCSARERAMPEAAVPPMIV